jgi:ribosomal protein S1
MRQEGQEVDVKIIRIEEERKRLGLSLLLDKNLESEEIPKDDNVDVESKEDGDQEPSSEESEDK